MFNITRICDKSFEDKSVKIAIFGEYGIGKTSLLNTLTEPTLCLDFEAGLLSVQDCKADTVKINTWDDARELVCIICGADEASSRMYSKAHYEQCVKKHGVSQQDFSKYKCIFIDSITVASKLCLEWSKTREECLKNGRVDSRAAYGKVAEEMLKWIHRLQHTAGLDVVIVGGIGKKDEDGWAPHIEGSKTSAELPGIFDEIIVMTQKNNERIFVCHTLNEWGYPAKDRSGKLDKIEPADLGKLINKIKGEAL